jgi:hypothetical protein
MTERNPPVWMQTGTYSAADDRLVTGMLFDRRMDAAGNFIAIDGGVIPPKNQMQLTAVGGVSMSFTISGGMCAIPVANSNPPGVYLCYNEGAYTGTIVPAGTQPRVDLVIAQASDTTSGGATSEWKFKVIQGSPGPNPAAPALPSNSVPIATVRAIPSGANGGVNKIQASQIADLRQFVVAPGGVHPTWGTNPNPPHSPGRLLYDATNKSLYVSNGSRWDIIYSYQEWLSYFAAYRPQQVTIGQATQAWSDTWVSQLQLRGSNPAKYVADEVSIPKLITPSGMIKVSIIGWGAVQNAGSVAAVGVHIKQQSNQAHVWGPEFTRGCAFYEKTWGHAGVYFLVSGLPVNTPLTVALQFRRTGAAGLAYFASQVLMAEAVI